MNKKISEKLLSLGYVWIFVTISFVFLVQTFAIIIIFLINFINGHLTTVQVEAILKLLLIMSIAFLIFTSLTAFLALKKFKCARNVKK